MECFIKKIWYGKPDEQAHRQLVRFGKGRFENRAALSLQKGEKIKLGGSFEFANDFSSFAAEFPAKFSGIILSRKELDFPGKAKSGIFAYNVEGIESEKVMKAKDEAYALLLDAEGQGISLKMKKKLPKPGKSGNLKVDDKFCILEADLKYWNAIKEAFSLPDCKKAKITHTYIIDEIVLPKGEKDFAKIREMSKRKGKIIKKSTVDSKESQEEKNFEA